MPGDVYHQRLEEMMKNGFCLVRARIENRDVKTLVSLCVSTATKPALTSNYDV